jgi:hypothetical protein
MPCQIGLPLGLGLCRTLRYKANRALPWTRALESKGKSDSPLDSGSGVQRQIGLSLGLGLPSPKKIGPPLGLGLWGPRPDRTPKSAPLKSDSGLDPGSVRFLASRFRLCALSTPVAQAAQIAVQTKALPSLSSTPILFAVFLAHKSPHYRAHSFRF